MCVCQLKWHRRSIRKQMNKVNSLSHVSLTLVNNSVDIFVFTEFNIYICFANIKRIQRIKTLCQRILYIFGKDIVRITISNTLLMWVTSGVDVFLYQFMHILLVMRLKYFIYLCGNHNIVSITPTKFLIFFQL